MLSTGRHAEAEKVIKYIAEKNGNHEFSQTFKIAPSEELEESPETVKEEPQQSYGLKDLFHRKIVLFTLVQMITWPAVSLGYFGISLMIREQHKAQKRLILLVPPITAQYLDHLSQLIINSGLSYGSSEMAGNFFVNNIILSAVELPGYLMIILLMDIWGRKPLFILCLIFTGASSIVSSYMDDEVRENFLPLQLINCKTGKNSKEISLNIWWWRFMDL